MRPREDHEAGSIRNRAPSSSGDATNDWSVKVFVATTWLREPTSIPLVYVEKKVEVGMRVDSGAPPSIVSGRNPMRVDSTTAVVLALGMLSGCVEVGVKSPTAASTPPATPAPTPAAGVVRLVESSMPPGSSVPVAPMFGTGQQAQQVWFKAAIRLDRAAAQMLVRAWVRTEAKRCMGGGQARVDFAAGVEQPVSPASMSSPEALCTLPFTTTLVEFEVVDSTGAQVLTQSFPAAYNFVAEN
jgi:hypothetical protein